MTGAELRGDELIAERRLSAAPERVWAAFTTPASLAAFWGGSHATVPPESVTVDLRPGGEFALDTRAPGGRGRRLRFVYVSVAAPHERPILKGQTHDGNRPAPPCRRIFRGIQDERPSTNPRHRHR